MLVILQNVDLSSDSGFRTRRICEGMPAPFKQMQQSDETADAPDGPT